MEQASEIVLCELSEISKKSVDPSAPISVLAANTRTDDPFFEHKVRCRFAGMRLAIPTATAPSCTPG
jgi:hypothetical protein